MCALSEADYHMAVVGPVGSFGTGQCCWLTILSGTQTYGGAVFLHQACFSFQGPFPRSGNHRIQMRALKSALLHALASTCCVSELTDRECLGLCRRPCVCVWACEHVCVIIVLCALVCWNKEGNVTVVRRALNCALHHFLCSHSAAVAGLHFLPLPSAEWSLFCSHTRSLYSLWSLRTLCALTCV